MTIMFVSGGGVNGVVVCDSMYGAQVTAPVRITELSYLFHLVKKSIKV